MNLDDLRLLLGAVKHSDYLGTQDRYKLEHRLELMIDFYVAKETMAKSKYRFENNKDGQSILKLE